MQTLNILFLGGAKRVSMARMFIEAGRAMGREVNIFSYELDERVPIACVGTVIKGLRWRDGGLLEDLHRVVVAHDIKVMVPFVDAAVGIAARYVDTYGDVFAPVSSEEMCQAMFDKVISADIFEQEGIPAPVTYRKGKPEFPLIAKPRTGSASQGIKIIENANDFRAVITPPGVYLIQEYIVNPVEYTVDCYVSREGEICCISPRRRVQVTGGEVSDTVTVDDSEIVEATRITLTHLGLRGAITVQFMRDPATGRLLIMEINPRLGGGAVCTVHAGVNLPAMILAEAMGDRPEPATTIKAGVEIVRYFQEVVFEN